MKYKPKSPGHQSHGTHQVTTSSKIDYPNVPGGINRERAFIGLPKIYERPLVQTPLLPLEGAEEETGEEDEEGEDVFE